MQPTVAKNVYGDGDDFVARADVLGHQAHQERVGARGHADAVRDVRILRAGRFAGVDRGPEDEVLRLHHVGDGLVDLWLDGEVLGLEIEQRNFHRLRFLELAIGLGAFGQLGRQRRFLVEIETAQRAVDLLIAQAAFRAPHDATGIGIGQTLPMAAHPADLARRVADHQRVVGHVLGHHRAGADEGVAADRGAADDGGVGADRAAALQQGLLVQRMAIHLRARDW